MEPAGRGRRLLDPEETAKIVPQPLYDRYRRGQPGELSRPQGWWDVYARDPEWTRQGPAATTTWSTSRPPGRVDGWVSYRVETRWPHGLAANIIKVRMLIGLTPEAEAAMWRYILDLDLAAVPTPGRSTTRSAGGWPTPWPRVTDVGDHLWVRLLDLPGALAAWRYAVSGTLVLEVTDAQRPRNQGRFRGSRAAPTAPPASRPRPTPTWPSTSPTSAPPTSAVPAWPPSPGPNGSPSSTPAPFCAPRPHVREYPAARLHHHFDGQRCERGP